MVSKVFSIRKQKATAAKTVYPSKDSTAVNVENDFVDWESSEKDALRIPVLSSEVKSGEELRAFGINEKDKHTQKAKCDIPVLVNTVEETAEQTPLSFQVLENIINKNRKPVDTNVESEETIQVAVYSDSREYFESFVELFNLETNNIEFIRYTQKDIPKLYQPLESFKGWVFNLSEHEDNDFLDAFLDNHDDADTLFLFEPTPSTKCVDKVREFII